MAKDKPTANGQTEFNFDQPHLEMDTRAMIWLICTLFLLLYSPLALGVDVLDFPVGSSLALGKHLSWIEVSPDDPNFQEERPGPWMDTYPRIHGQDNTLNFGYTQKKIWFEIGIRNTTLTHQSAVLVVSTAWLDSILLFSGEAMHDVTASGDAIPRELWPQPFRLPAFKFQLEPGQTQRAWLMIQSQDAMIVPLKIWDEGPLARWERNRNIQEGLYMGLIATICIINASIFFFTMQTAFLAYACYLSFYLLTQMSLDGIVGLFVPNFPPWLINRSYAFLNIGTVASGALFMVKFLSLRKYAPRLARLVSISSLGFLVYGSLTVFWPVNTIPLISSILYSSAIAPIALVSAAKVMPFEPRSAKFFMIAWFPVVVCVALIAMTFLSIITWDIDSRGILFIGIALQAIIFSLALGDQLALSIRENARAKINLESAEAVQKALMPSHPSIPGCRLHGWYRSADTTGGDWYDVIYNEKESILYCFIGDVTGHGISSTLVSSTVAGTVHGVIEQQMNFGSSMRKTLEAVAESVNRAVKRTGAGSGRLLTLNLIGINLRTLEGVLFNAGHCHPLIFRNNHVVALASQGSILGLEDNLELIEKSFQLKQRDILFLYSDGLIHTHTNGKVELRLNRLSKQICSGSSAFEVVETAKQKWIEAYTAWPLEDDCSILALDFQSSPVQS